MHLKRHCGYENRLLPDLDDDGNMAKDENERWVFYTNGYNRGYTVPTSTREGFSVPRLETWKLENPCEDREAEPGERLVSRETPTYTNRYRRGLTRYKYQSIRSRLFQNIFEGTRLEVQEW